MKIIYFSDGPFSQDENKYNLPKLSIHFKYFGINTEWSRVAQCGTLLSFCNFAWQKCIQWCWWDFERLVIEDSTIEIVELNNCSIVQLTACIKKKINF